MARMCAAVEAAEAAEKRDRVVARARAFGFVVGVGLGPGRGGGGGDCRGGCLIARRFAGAYVVGRRLSAGVLAVLVLACTGYGGGRDMGGG